MAAGRSLFRNQGEIYIDNNSQLFLGNGGIRRKSVLELS
jgi:hypothetical protein